MPRSGEDSRRRLQGAAFALFEERGYDQTTAAGIAARAGVTERTFFRHFPDKREVLFAGEAAFREALVAGIAGAPESLAPLEAIRWGVRAISGAMEEVRAFGDKRRKLIDATPALREREFAKAGALMGGVTDALRGRGVEGPEAQLAAQLGLAAFSYAFASWAGEAKGELDEHFTRAFVQMRALIEGGAKT